MKSVTYLKTVWLWIRPASSSLRATLDSELPDETVKATGVSSSALTGPMKRSVTKFQPVSTRPHTIASDAVKTISGRTTVQIQSYQKKPYDRSSCSVL